MTVLIKSGKKEVILHHIKVFIDVEESKDKADGYERTLAEFNWLFNKETLVDEFRKLATNIYTYLRDDPTATDCEVEIDNHGGYHEGDVSIISWQNLVSIKHLSDKSHMSGVSVCITIYSDPIHYSTDDDVMQRYMEQKAYHLWVQ